MLTLLSSPCCITGRGALRISDHSLVTSLYPLSFIVVVLLEIERFQIFGEGLEKWDRYCVLWRLINRTVSLDGPGDSVKSS